MSVYQPICNAFCIGLCIYARSSAPQPRPPVMVLLILGAAVNAGALSLWLIARKRRERGEPLE